MWFFQYYLALWKVWNLHPSETKIWLLAVMSWLCAVMSWLCAVMSWLCAVMSWLCAVMSWLCAVMSWLCAVMSWLCAVMSWLCAVMSWLCAVMSWLCAVMSWLCAVMSWLCAVIEVCVFQVGGNEEYKLVSALRDGRVNKPVVAWCIGTCADMFTSEVRHQLHTAQFSTVHISMDVNWAVAL